MGGEINKKQIAIERSKSYLPTEGSHNDFHVESMLNHVSKITKSIPDVNLDVLEIACWWHDVGRSVNNENHEKISANMAKKELEKIGYDTKFSQKVYDAIVNHAMNANPKTIEGKILKDADKLDYMPLWRWKAAIDNKEIEGIEASIKNLPKIRTRLFFDASKEIFDNLYTELMDFIKQDKSSFLRDYKVKLLNLKIEK